MPGKAVGARCLQQALCCSAEPCLALLRTSLELQVASDQGLQTPSWLGTWGEVRCQGSGADFNCSCTISARPGLLQRPGGMDASQLWSVTSDGWMHPDSLQHRTCSIPKLSSYPPQSQQSTWISREPMKKSTPPLHPFAKQQSFSLGRGKQLLSKPMG